MSHQVSCFLGHNWEPEWAEHKEKEKTLTDLTSLIRTFEIRFECAHSRYKRGTEELHYHRRKLTPQFKSQFKNFTGQLNSLDKKIKSVS